MLFTNSPSLSSCYVAYENLFRFLGQNNGATLFNNFWFYAMFVNILGVIPYLMLTNKKKD